MSIQLVAWALEHQDLPLDKRTGQPDSGCAFVLVALANHADPEGCNSFPSVATIQRYTKLSERNVQYKLRALEDHGTIAKTPNPLIRAATIGRPDQWPQSYDIVAYQRGAKSEDGVQSQASRGAKSKIESPDTGCKLDGDFAPEPSLNLNPQEEPKEEPKESDVADAPPDTPPTPTQPDSGDPPPPPVKARVKKQPPTEPERADVTQLCTQLRDAMLANGCRPPEITHVWRAAARRLIDLDRRPLDEALQVLAWCQADEFWQTNILSMPKFRTQYDRLRMQWQQRNGRHLQPVGSSGGWAPYQNPDPSAWDNPAPMFPGMEPARAEAALW